MQVLIRSASLYVLLNQLNRDNGALFLPKAAEVPFLILAALPCFLLTSSTTVKNHTKAKMCAVWVPLKAISSVMHYYYN